MILANLLHGNYYYYRLRLEFEHIRTELINLLRLISEGSGKEFLVADDSEDSEADG